MGAFLSKRKSSNKTKDKTSKKYKGAKKTKAVSTEETRHWSLDASKAKETELLEDGNIVLGGPGTDNQAESRKAFTLPVLINESRKNQEDRNLDVFTEIRRPPLQLRDIKVCAEERLNKTVLRPKDSAIIVVAVDFGTSYTGYAYSFKSEPRNIIANYWDGKVKTPTMVLLDPKGRFQSFGSSARTQYEKLLKENNHMNWYLFERFKMTLLATGKTLSRDMQLTDITDKPMKAFNVFVEALRYIKKHLVDNLQHPSRLGDIAIKTDKEIHWLLTVPAIWDDLSKRFMRDAAVMAGIPDDMLSLALEPEAASVYCKQTMDTNKIKVGTRYIVVDLGGGTADITCHEAVSSGALKELHPPTGGDFGGTNVDNALIKLIVSIFGADIWKKFKNSHTREYWELMSDFEIKKRYFSGKEKVILKFPATLLGNYESETGKTIEESMKQSTLGNKVQFKLGKMIMDVSLTRQLFDETFVRIDQSLKGLLLKIRKVDFIMMVGGFSESPYIQQRMREEFGDKVIVPSEPSGAVVKGAVMYGHAATVIESRMCKYTYGIAQLRKFQADKHFDREMIWIDSKPYCDNIFNKHIEIGTEVSLSSEENADEHEYFPAAADVRQAVLEVYASTERNPRYIDEPGCQFVGLVKIDIDPKGNYWAKYMVQMCFGGTELKIRVRDVKTGTVTTGFVDFLG